MPFAVLEIVPLGGKGDDHELRCHRPRMKRTFASGEECRLWVREFGATRDALLIERDLRGRIHALFAAKKGTWRKLPAALGP